MTATWAAVILLLFYLSYVIFHWSTDPLHKVPGPNLERFSKLWIGVRYAGGKFEKINPMLHQKYG